MVRLPYLKGELVMSAVTDAMASFVKNVLRNPAAHREFVADHEPAFAKVDRLGDALPDHDALTGNDLWNSSAAADTGRLGIGPQERMSGTGASAMTGRYSPNATDGSPGGYSEIAQRFENLEKSVSGIASVLNSMLRAMKAEDDDDDEGGEKDKDTDEDEAEKSHKRTGDMRAQADWSKAAASNGEFLLDTDIRGFFDSIRGLKKSVGKASKVQKPPQFYKGGEVDGGLDAELDAAAARGASAAELLGIQTRFQRLQFVKSGALQASKLDWQLDGRIRGDAVDAQSRWDAGKEVR